MKIQKVKWPALAVLITLLFPGLAAGATASQWAPSAGTTVDYTTKFFHNQQDGTSSESTLVNIYNSTYFYIVPSTLVYGPTPYDFETSGRVLLAANASLVVRHRYEELSSTTLSRPMELIAGNLILANHTVYWVLDTQISGYTAIPMNLPGIFTFQKGDFPQDPLGCNWIDHVDNSVETGQIFEYYLLVVSRTPSQIILRGTYNNTYTAGSDGKVTSFTWFSSLSSPGLTAGYMFENTSGIPGPTFSWIIASMMIGSVIAVSLVRRLIHRRQNNSFVGLP